MPAGQRVAGSIGPVHDCYRPDLSPGEGARADHAELAAALARAGVDLLLCETFANSREAVVAVEAAVETGVETWVALTAGPDARLLEPSAMRDTARACVERGARAVLVNCTPATRTLAYVNGLSELGVAFGAYANAGHEDEGIEVGSERSDEGARRYAALARVVDRRGRHDPGRLLRDGACARGAAIEAGRPARTPRSPLGRADRPSFLDAAPRQSVFSPAPSRSPSSFILSCSPLREIFSKRAACVTFPPVC